MTIKAIVTRESLILMIQTSPTKRQKHIVGRALVAIFNKQTDEEKNINSTKENNGIGFAGCDARTGSITAKYYLKHKTIEDWQLEKWLTNDRIIKYHKQLNAIAISKQ